MVDLYINLKQSTLRSQTLRYIGAHFCVLGSVPRFQRHVLKGAKTLSEQSKFFLKSIQKRRVFVLESDYKSQNAQFGLV